MSHDQIIKLVVAVIMAVIVISSVKKGLKRGFMRELGSTLSFLLSLLCIFLILLLYTAVRDKTYGTVVTAVIALILLGLFAKVGRGIGSALTGITELTVVSWIDRALGAVLGLGEAVFFIYIFNRIMAQLGKTAYLINFKELFHL